MQTAVGNQAAQSNRTMFARAKADRYACVAEIHGREKAEAAHQGRMLDRATDTLAMPSVTAMPLTSVPVTGHL
jgi:hypothetical protein